MNSDYSNYEMVQHEENLPYTIFIHTKERIENDGYLDPRGKLVVPNLMNHWHEALEMDYLFRGSCQYMVNGREFLVSQDQFILINCRDIHCINFDFTTDEPEIIGFTLLISEDFIRTLVPDIDQSIFENERIRENDRIRDLMLQIYRLHTQPQGEYTGIAITSQITMLIYELCSSGAKRERAIIPINSQKSVERLRGILQYVEEHYTENLVQEEMANRFHFSRVYFARFFKKYTGMTFTEYLTRYRLLMARELLLNTDLNMTEVAMHCGFSDSRRFIIAYKKHYGTTPYQHRLAENRE